MTIHRLTAELMPGDMLTLHDTDRHAYYDGEKIIPLCPWVNDDIGPAIDAGLDSIDPTPHNIAVKVMEILESFGYDSIDRESSFAIATARFSLSYESIYDAWIAAEQSVVR
jgi:hypothetical protein